MWMLFWVWLILFVELIGFSCIWCRICWLCMIELINIGVVVMLFSLVFSSFVVFGLVKVFIWRYRLLVGNEVFFFELICIGSMVVVCCVGGGVQVLIGWVIVIVCVCVVVGVVWVIVCLGCVRIIGVGWLCWVYYCIGLMFLILICVVLVLVQLSFFVVVKDRLMIWLEQNGLWLLMWMIMFLLLFRLVICIQFGNGRVLCVVVMLQRLQVLLLVVVWLWNLVLYQDVVLIIWQVCVLFIGQQVLFSMVQGLVFIELLCGIGIVLGICDMLMFYQGVLL